MIKDSHKQFLLGPARADKVRHSGRTLYEHLVGTHDLLEAWGATEAVCDAGLFHSIYGTKHFRQKAWPIADRATIVKLIGEYAEELVFLFCMADRPRALLADGRLGTNRHLREIETANLIEQGSKSGWLRQLHDSKISDPAKRAIEQYLQKAA